MHQEVSEQTKITALGIAFDVDLSGLIGRKAEWRTHLGTGGSGTIREITFYDFPLNGLALKIPKTIYFDTDPIRISDIQTLKVF